MTPKWGLGERKVAPANEGAVVIDAALTLLEKGTGCAVKSPCRSQLLDSLASGPALDDVDLLISVQN